MSLTLKNKKTQILLYSLAFTLVIFLLNKNSNLSPISPHRSHLNFRFLIETEDVDKRCKKTPKNFLVQYKVLEIKDSKLDDSSLDKYQQVLKDMINDKKLNKIKKYLPRIIIYLIFIIVDIILLIIWFIFCGCCCCGKKNKDAANGCAKFYFFLFFFLGIIVILICAYGFIITPSFYKSINGIICSLYKLVFHFTEGTKEDYPQNNWKGFEGINNLTQEYSLTYEKINSLNEITCSSMDEYCTVYNNILSRLKAKQNDEFIGDLIDAGEKINSTSEVFNEIKNNTLDDIEEVMVYFDKYCKLGLYVLFIAIAVFSLFGLITLTAYFVCNCNCISCLFHLFWNIEMLIILITMLAGIGFGLAGVVGKDAIELLKYAKSEENINNEEEPFLLTFNKEYKEQINECLNKDGNLTSLFGSEYNYQSNIDDYAGDFETKYNELKNKNNADNYIVKLYEEMNLIIISLKELNNNLKQDNLTKIFDCSFFKRDFEILTTEIKDTMCKKFCFFALVIIVVDLVAFLSILFGVLVASNYTGQKIPLETESHDRHIKMSTKDNKHNMDSSSDNLRK